MGLVEKVFRGSSYIFLSKLVDAIVAIAFTIVIARMLGPNTYGLIGASLGIAYIIGLVATVGVPDSAAKYISQFTAKNDKGSCWAIVRSSLLIQIVLGVIFSSLCFLLADPLSVYVFHKPQISPPLKILSLMIIFRAASGGFMGIFQGLQKMHFFAVSNIIDFFVRFSTAVLLVLLGFGVVGAISGFVLGSFFGLLSAGFFFWRRIVPEVIPVSARTSTYTLGGGLRDLLRIAIPIMGSAAAILLFTWMDTLALTAYCEIRDVSWYNIAYGIVALVMIVPSSVNISFLPMASAMWSRGEMEKLRKSYEVGLKLMTFCINGIMIGLLALSPQIILLLYGSSYLGALIPLSVLWVWGILRPLSIFSESVAVGIGKPSLNMFANGLTAFLSIILNLVLVPSYGLLGASVASTVALSTGSVVLVLMVKKKIGSKIPLRANGISYFSAVVGGLAILGVSLLLFQAGWSHGVSGLLAMIFIAYLVGLFVYLVLLSILGGIEAEDIRLLESMRVPLKRLFVRTGKILLGFSWSR